MMAIIEEPIRSRGGRPPKLKDDQVVKFVSEHGEFRVTMKHLVSELPSMFGVSQATVRNRVKDLIGKGILASNKVEGVTFITVAQQA